MNRKIWMAAVSIVFISGVVNAAIDAPEEMDNVQRFYYELGYEKAKSQYEEVGYRKALRDFEKLLEQHKRKWQAYEAGKYLIKEGKLTYPQVYRERNGNSYSIHIEPSTIEKEFSERELFILPLIERLEAGGIHDELEVQQHAPQSSGQRARNENAYAMVDMPAQTSEPYSAKTHLTVDFPYFNAGIKQTLDSFNIKYSTSNGATRMYFVDANQKDFFCTKLTGNTECKPN